SLLRLLRPQAVLSALGVVAHPSRPHESERVATSTARSLRSGSPRHLPPHSAGSTKRPFRGRGFICAIERDNCDNHGAATGDAGMLELDTVRTEIATDGTQHTADVFRSCMETRTLVASARNTVLLSRQLIAEIDTTLSNRHVSLRQPRLPMPRFLGDR